MGVESAIFLGLTIGMVVAVFHAIQSFNAPPVNAAQQRAMREDCRRKGL
jgi:hypothetical protein